MKILSRILDNLFELEQNQPFELSVIVLTNSQQVEDYVNTNPRSQFDIILLDRDCKLNKSFHILDIEKIGADKIIAISSVPEYNQEAKQRGVKKVVLKDMRNIDSFAKEVTKEVEKMITPSRLIKLFNRNLSVAEVTNAVTTQLKAPKQH